MGYKTQRHKEIRNRVSELGLFLKTNSTSFFLKKCVYLFGCARSWLGHMGSLVSLAPQLGSTRELVVVASKLSVAACGI